MTLLNKNIRMPFKHGLISSLVRSAMVPKLVVIVLGGSVGAATAAPEGGVVTAGQGDIQQSSYTTIVNQQSHSLVVDWNSFNVAADEAVRFQQPSSSATALNRIGGQSPSEIYGSIDANGRVFLINPNGIIFGQSSVVNVASLLATGLNMDPVGFMNGDYSLFTESTSTPGMVVNRGLLQAATGGSINLVGGAVVNEGIIVADLGQVNLGSGRAAVLDFDGDGLIGFAVSDEVVENLQGLDSSVSNSGQISANGGQVLMTASVAKDVFNYAVNNTGIIRANRIDRTGGEVRLVGTGSPVVNSGNGEIDVSGQGDSDGGTVHILGEKVGMLDNATIDASGSSGGGTVLIGGEYQGGSSLMSADVTYMGDKTSIKADAIENGNGGKVIVWANDTARVYGDISARGGAESGNGGFIETSGKKYLDFQGSVSAAAVKGNNGTWLLDPENIEIVASGETNITETAGEFTPTVVNTVTKIDASSINSVLDSGTDVAVRTAGAGTAAGDITILENIVKTNANTASLTLDATNDIIFGNGTISGDTITINTNGGDFISNGKAFNSSGKAATINAGTGSVTLNHSGAVDFTTVSAASLNVTAGDVITQSNESTALSIVGTTTLNAGANDITLGNTSNDFQSNVVANGKVVTLTDANSINLGASTITGALNVSATTGAVTQNGKLDVTGVSTFNSGSDIILDDINNDFKAAVNSDGNSVTLVDKNNILLGTSTVGGSLNVTTNGNISQTDGGVLAVNGVSSFTVKGTNTDVTIDLDNAKNVFANDPIFSTPEGAVVSSFYLWDSTSTKLSDFALNANNIQNVSLRYDNVTTLTLPVSLSPTGNVNLQFDKAAVELPELTLTGGLSVTAGGNITQSGPLKIDGATTLSAGVNNISLTNEKNDFSVVNIESAYDTKLVDINKFVLGTQKYTGHLDVINDVNVVLTNVNRGQSATFGFSERIIDPSLFDLSISFVEIVGDGVKLLEEGESMETQ